MGDLPHRVPPDPRYFTADIHITPDGRARIGPNTYTPEQYGDLLRRTGWDGRTPIRLIGCDAGSNTFADRLARHTNADVLAPTKPAWTDNAGRVYTSDAEIAPDGTRRPRIPPNGEWNTHRPDGTTTQASPDGYVPQTPDHHRTDHSDADGAQDRAADSSEPDDDQLDQHAPVPSPKQYLPEVTPSRVVHYDGPTRGPSGDYPPPYTRPDADGRPGSPVEIDLDEQRGRVRDPAGPPRPVESTDPNVPAVPKHPDVLDDHVDPATGKLTPETQYTVRNPNGTRTDFFTDANGDIKWAQATSGTKKDGFNPDLDYPLLGDVTYKVDNNWEFHTNQHGQTTSVTGEPDYQKSDSNRRDDSGGYSAQGRANSEGKAAYPEVKWAGGHLAANESGGPGEYINMFAQMNASNSGHNREGWVYDASWRSFEKDLAAFDAAPGQRISNYQVEMERQENGVPAQVTMRWTQEVDGPPATTETWQVDFPNTPDTVNYADPVPYRR